MGMKGYKAFRHGFYCEVDGNRKQYEENSIAEDTGAGGCCEKGVMHFCETPFDTLNYYPLIDDNGNFTEFAEVEALDEVYKKEDKRATKKLMIGAKLSFKDFIKVGIDVLIETTKLGKIKNNSDNDNGNYWAKIGSSGDRAKIGSSGDWAQIGSSGDWAKIGSSGDRAQIGSSGDWAKIGSSGDRAKIGSSGDRAQIGSSGDWAQIGSSGDWAQIGSSGYGAKINADGQESVIAAIGVNSMVRAGLGCWITLAEYDNWNGRYYPVLCVKSAQVDGVTLKPDTWYKLENGEFVEVEDGE